MNLVERLRNPKGNWSEQMLEAADRIEALEAQNKDKSQLLANYRNQITSLVKEKHRREE